MTSDGSIPQHRKLYEILRRHITEGVYKEGDLLPSENELCQLYGMTRPTVRQSLASLANDGYIRKHQGKGSIVQHPPEGYRDIVGIRNNFSSGQQEFKNQDHCKTIS